MRVVLNHKLVLARGLSWTQVDDLIKQIRSRPALKDTYGDLWTEKKDDGYILYLLDPRSKQFIDDPHSFIFEV